MNKYATTLPDFMIKNAVIDALKEDLGRAGDITTDSIVSPDLLAEGLINARETGVVAGRKLAEQAFLSLSENVTYETLCPDGSTVAKGEAVARITGPARALLTGERVALNFLGRLSGVATLTRKFVNAVSGTQCQICCTRKTTPGLRTFEKYAVKTGGGRNHRFGLDDAVMIKDNHIAVAGSITSAVAMARLNIGHNVKIEVEVDTLEQLQELLTCDADIVLLDNMAPEKLREAVNMIDNRLIIEASGGVTLENIRDIAETGVDLISVGALTHSAPVLDLGLDFKAPDA